MGGSSGTRSVATAVAAMASIPFLRVIAANPVEQLPIGRFLLYWLIIVIPAGFVALKSQRIGTAVALILFVFGGLAVTLQSMLSVPEILGISGVVWISVALAIGGVLFSRWSSVSVYVAVLAGLLVTLPVFQIVSRVNPAKALFPPEQSAESWTGEPANTPNIYWFALDGYGQVDSPEFHTRLARKGFTVSKEATASYPLTYLSLASTLAGQYVDVSLERHRFDPLLRGDNATVLTLKQWGYSYVLYPADGFDGTACAGYEDLCLDSSGMTESDWALLRQTPVPSLMPTRFAHIHDQRADPLHVLRLLNERNPKTPFFVFAHLINPHPPYYRTGSHCDLQPVEHTLIDSWGTPTEYQQVTACLNHQLDLAVNQILDRDPNAIVILQGDHGPAFNIDLYDGPLTWTDQQIRDRFGVFSAIRLPCFVPDDLAIVNTTRLLAGCLTGQEIPMLSLRRWMANFSGETREI